MRKRIENIGQLWGIGQPASGRLSGAEMQAFSSIKNAWLLIEGDRIVSYGSMKAPDESAVDEVFDAAGDWVFPAFCDSHTHLVHAASRDQELLMKLQGLDYETIAARGGGILNSAKRLAEMSEDELFQLSLARLRAMAAMGVGAVEIKSGYGLDPQNELKMLRVVARLKQASPVLIKATFLALHALPLAFQGRKQAFVDLMVKEVLPQVAQQGLADFVDVFCERNYFDLDDMRLLLTEANRLGLPAKVHVNQFSSFGAVKTAVELGAISVDHLEVMEGADFEAIKNSNTMATVLPGCSLYLGIPFAPARQLVDAGVALAVASDFNPGSAPSYNPELNLSLAVLKSRLLPEEAWNALTINGAAAMQLEQEVGSIWPQKKANLLFTRALPSLTYMPYAFGERKIKAVWLNGQPYSEL